MRTFLTKGIEVTFSKSKGGSPAVFCCDTDGLYFCSDGFETVQSEIDGSVGSENVLWESSDICRFDSNTLLLKSFLISLPDAGDVPKGSIRATENDGDIMIPKLAERYLPFVLNGPDPTSYTTANGILSLYSSTATIALARKIAPNLSMLFEESGFLCGWYMDRFLDHFTFDDEAVTGHASDQTYEVFKSYFRIFTQSLFKQEDAIVVAACRDFIGKNSGMAFDLRVRALFERLNDVMDRFS